MLEKIAAHRAYPQLPASPADSPVKSPIRTAVPVSPRIPPNEPFMNAIGALQSLCGDNSLEEPKYISISDEGPPHAKIFTYQCVLSMFKEEGVATTKKQAKHEAARKMLNRIKDLVINYPEFSNDDHDVVSESNAIAISLYPQLTKISQKKVNLGLKISQYHIALKQFVMAMNKEIVEELKSIKLDMDKSELSDDILKRLQTVLTPLAINHSITTLDSKESDIVIVCIGLDTSPSIIQCGTGKSEEEAIFKAIPDIINSLILLLE
ncbi:PREDICTED: interferon-inducible double-stranded RNA-dependent protein kinase activator A homolog B-like isoform X2 [Polistes dominula]|nr:PREDICTED: interferon-inducible double-stranded RNA-dependent protein kinase activator A homolog B-like isoform X2 [Polistes dominula]